MFSKVHKNYLRQMYVIAVLKLQSFNGGGMISDNEIYLPILNVSTVGTEEYYHRCYKVGN